MPSQEVLKSLQSLHEELNKLEPAIKHVETAVDITNTVKTIPDKHNELLVKLKEADEQIRENLAKDFGKRVDEIKQENSNIVSELKKLKDEISGYHQKLEELSNQIKNYYEKIESVNFPERLDKIDNTISGINIGIQNMQSGFRDFEKQIRDTIQLSDNKQSKRFSVNLILLIAIMLSVIGIFALNFIQ